VVEIREIGADGWRAMQDIRLAALQDAPQAFASTYEREVAFVQADWLRRISGGANFLAYAPELGTAAVGIAGGIEGGPGTIARLLYEWCGFRPTAERQPLPSDAQLPEIGMARSLDR
jgi:hypothetical protein